MRGRERGSVVSGRDSEKQRERHKRFLRLRLGVHKGMELNDHKEMEWNGMYLSNGKEWKKIE